MCIKYFFFVALSATLLLAQNRPAAPSEELNTILMHSTFRITGPLKDHPESTSFGTVFTMGIPWKSNPETASLVAVTASHVLSEIAGDYAVLLLRRKNADGGYTPFEYRIQIRDKGVPLYKTLPNADVAAMYLDVPNDVPMSGLPPDFLADDKRLEDIDVHPGDEVTYLGFPLLANTPGAFPILRSGRIASYPITPMEKVREIYLDALVYGGNSGGPVYYTFSNRYFKGGTHIGMNQSILGLVIQESHSAIPEFANKTLNLGIIVPASFIRKVIDLLPFREEK